MHLFVMVTDGAALVSTSPDLSMQSAPERGTITGWKCVPSVEPNIRTASPSAHASSTNVRLAGPAFGTWTDAPISGTAAGTSTVNERGAVIQAA